MVQSDKLADFRKWLWGLAENNTSTEADDERMQNTLRLLGFTKAVCTCGIAHLYGEGETVDIHSIAKKLKEALSSGK